MNEGEEQEVVSVSAKRGASFFSQRFLWNRGKEVAFSMTFSMGMKGGGTCEMRLSLGWTIFITRLE